MQSDWVMRGSLTESWHQGRSNGDWMCFRFISESWLCWCGCDWLCVCVRVCAYVCVCVCFHVKEFANVPEHHDSVEAWVSPNSPHPSPCSLPVWPHPPSSFELTLHPTPPKLDRGFSPESCLRAKMLSRVETSMSRFIIWKFQRARSNCVFL